MVRIDFNQLPRVARERFVRALASDPPQVAPICSQREERAGSLPWILVTAAALGLLGGAAAIHFGDITAPVQDRRYLAVYVAGCAVLGLAIATLLRRRAEATALPFPSGVYVLPLDVVDARDRELDLHSLADLESVEAVHHQRSGVYSHSTLWLAFPGQTFTFDVRGLAYADGLVMRIQEARYTLTTALQRGRFDDLWGVDPFAEARAHGFEAVDEPGLRARDPGIWTRFVWAIAIVSGLLPGVGFWRGRNAVSDGRAYAKLLVRPDEATASAYTKAGGLHGAELERAVVPKLQLDAARKVTPARARITALEKFLKDHPRSAVESDAKAALAEALHAHFAEQTTVSGLRSFLATWPGAADAAAAKTKIHAIYKEALAELHRHASSEKNVAPVVDALLGWGDEHPAPIEVRFRHRSTGSLVAADKLLVAGLLDDGSVAQNGNAEASPHFGGPALAMREDAVVRGLEKAFRGVFPVDAIALRAGPSLPDVPERPSRAGGLTRPLGEVTAPTIIVDYELGWNGMTYVSRDRRRRFLGIFAKMEVVIQVPKEARPLSFALRPSPLDASSLEAEIQPDDARMYDAILVRSFERATPQLASVVFEPRYAAKVAQPL